MLDELMRQLAKELDLDLKDLQTEVPSVYAIPIEQQTTILIRSNPPLGFSFNCTLGPCPKEKEEAFLADLLLANLFGQSTHGAVLGLSEDGNLLTLSQIIDYNIDYKEFNESLEDFLNTADFWFNEKLIYDK